MTSSPISMPTGGSQSRLQRHFNRSTSQPVSECHYNFLSSYNSNLTYPMRNLFGNLLHLQPNRYISPFNTFANHSKLSSSLSTTIPSERSSRVKLAHTSVISSFSIRSGNAHSPQEIRPPPTKLTAKFRRAGNLILFAIYWCNFARKKNHMRSMVYQSYLQTAAPTEKYMFDKSHFKIQTIEILPIVREFFKQPTGQRDIVTADQIRQCLIDIKPFTRLTKSLQDLLLQKGWYECYPDQRTIVRQGERATCFYIILSGSAIPTYKRATDGSVETLDVLKRGSTFGEKGLMTDSTQNFTVVSKTKIELLVLWKDDFRAIYMTIERHCSKDDLKFLKNQVLFLRGFPIDRLYETPNAIQNCHFGSSEVIAKDSRRMKYLYVVKKGSLAIWKRLDPNGYNPEKKLMDNDNEATGDNRTLFSEIRLSGDIDESTSNMNALDADFRLSRLRREPTEDQRISSAESRAVANDIQKFPGLVDKRDRLQLIDYDGIPTTGDNPTKLTLNKSFVKRTQSVIKPSTPVKLLHPNKMMYIHIKTLNEGQYFGLADLFFPNQPELTLVSNECECLLLNKVSFLHLASDQYKQNIRRSEMPYPTDSVFYKNYHTNEVWKRFSKQMYIDAYERIKQRHPNKIQRSSTVNERKQPMIVIGAS